MSKLISWDNMMDQSLKIPGMKVNRIEFLTEAFKNYGDDIAFESNRPIDYFEKSTIEKVAKDVINKHLTLVSLTSTAAGIPGGFAMIGTIPADMAQFYGHVLVSAQKLSYLYGWPNLLDEENKVTEGTRNILTLFVGVMFGAQTANKAISELSKNVSIQVAKRVPQKALTKTAYYPVVKEIGKWIGLKVTKESFSKGISKVVPILGGAVSGGITYVSFKTMSKKLHVQLSEEMSLQQSWVSNNTFNNDVKDFENENHIKVENLELIRLKCCINMAKIDFNLDESERDFLLNLIDNSSLIDEEKMDLLNNLRNQDLFDIDFTEIKKNELYSISLLENLSEIIHIDSNVKIAEKIYFNKIAGELGFSADQVSEFLLIRN